MFSNCQMLPIWTKSHDMDMIFVFYLYEILPGFLALDVFLPLFTSQRTILPVLLYLSRSSPPVTKYRPSGLKATA